MFLFGYHSSGWDDAEPQSFGSFSSTPALTEESMSSLGTEFSCSHDKRFVCFFESSNQVHTYERVTKEERGDVWYTAQDYEAFRRERRQLAGAVQHKEACQAQNCEHEDTAPSTWSQMMIHLYSVFRQYEDPHELDTALGYVPGLSMDTTTIGLEHLILPPIAHDYSVRRQHLLEQIRRLQGCMYDSDEARESMLRDTSRLSSRAARLFAQYVATAAAQSF